MEIENKFVGPEGPLQGWSISTYVSVAVGASRQFWELCSFSSTFRKQHAVQTPQTLVLTHFEVTESRDDVPDPET